jgi:uncharacterized membrane protein
MQVLPASDMEVIYCPKTIDLASALVERPRSKDRGRPGAGGRGVVNATVGIPTGRRNFKTSLQLALWDDTAMRISSAGHAAFAAVMIGIGIQGLITGQFTTVWQPVPAGVPARQTLVYLCALLSLGSGLGLLWRRSAGLAAGLLLVALVVWLLLWRARALFIASLIEGSWSFANTLVMTAGALVLFAWFGGDRDREGPAFEASDWKIRAARVLYGLGMIPFGYAHFANVKGTAALVPRWLPWHMGWAYFTGGAFVAAGVAILMGRLGRLAATLSALQMGLFGLLVWVPIMVAGSASAFQRMEFATTLALAAAGWVVADSYRNTGWR